MKFSYTLLKKLVPEIKNAKVLEQQLSLHAFEVDSVTGKTFDIKLPANRYGDAASHWGMAQEIAACMGVRFGEQRAIASFLATSVAVGGKSCPFAVTVEDRDLCPRYIGAYCEHVAVGDSPKWIKDILIECGMRPINVVVDVMNYVMLETGQPLHAFDYDKIEGDVLFVRRAKKGEQITTLDNQHVELTSDMLVIADTKHPLAIAGIKGGKRAEVDKHTTRIVIEAANFDAVNIYTTSRAIGLTTDASARFSRTLNPELATLGIIRACKLLQSIMGMQQKAVIDMYPRKQAKRVVRFDLAACNAFLGTQFDAKTVRTYLALLGFSAVSVPVREVGKKNISTFSFTVTISPLRTDIEHPHDLFEELVRLYGFGNLRASVPYARLIPSEMEDAITLKDNIRFALVSLGVDEVYNHSFVNDAFGGNHKNVRDMLVSLENPISKEYAFMRPTLAAGLHANMLSNSRYFDAVSAFEIGRVFEKEGAHIAERNMLGIVLASKGNEQFFVLKGLLRELFYRIGLTDFVFIEGDSCVYRAAGAYISGHECLSIESAGKSIGYLAKITHAPAKWHGALAELDMELLTALAVAEHEYIPLPKYPSIVRDLSVVVGTDVRVGDIMQEIQFVDKELIEDVDLIDEYENKQLGRKRSFTFRIVFQAADRTLTDTEVHAIMERVTLALRKAFTAEIR